MAGGDAKGRHASAADILEATPPDAMTEIAGVTAMPETLTSDGSLSSGTPVGFSVIAGSEIPVCIPFPARCRHAHLIGRPGTGKTSVMEGMILDDVRRAIGLVVLDTYGDLCERLLCHIPAEAVERTVYLSRNEESFTLLWRGVRHDRT
jgi:hypothetical protein